MSENRTRNDYPLLEWTASSLSTYPTRFEGAFNDNFGFRALLVQWQALAKFYWLKMSPSRKVIRGREGWFYLVNSINEHRGIQRLPKATVAAWVREFQAKKTFLEARGIRYLIVIAPNKETIYPEFLPQGIRQIRKKLWLDDILEALPINSGVDILDLRAPLLEAKKFGRLYQRTDSHWTGLGLEVATNAIIARLVSKCPGLKPGKIDQSPSVAWGKKWRFGSADGTSKQFAGRSP